jgi:hypothetical protein
VGPRLEGGSGLAAGMLCSEDDRELGGGIKVRTIQRVRKVTRKLNQERRERMKESVKDNGIIRFEFSSPLTSHT